MWFEQFVPAPRRLPDIPMRLGDCVRAFRSGTIRIDVHVRAGKGWQKVNALRFEDGDDAQDPGTIAMLVMACAEYHAGMARAPGKYRAMLWRYVGGELERRKAAFDVTLPHPARLPRSGRARPRARSPRDVQRTALETRMLLEELPAHDAYPSFEPLTVARPTRPTVLDRVQRVLAGMAERFDGALTHGTAGDIDQADFEIRWEVATLCTQEDGDLWTAIAPTIDACLDRLRTETLANRRAMGSVESPGSATTTRAQAPTDESASASAAERKEGAPPCSGDAPSPGKDSGA